MCAVNQVCRSLVISPVGFLSPHILPWSRMLRRSPTRRGCSGLLQHLEFTGMPDISSAAFLLYGFTLTLMWCVESVGLEAGLWLAKCFKQSLTQPSLFTIKSVQVFGSWSTALDELRYWKIYHRSYLRVQFHGLITILPFMACCGHG